jgi:hypothetical protein
VRDEAQAVQLQGSGHIYSLASVVGLVGPADISAALRKNAIQTPSRLVKREAHELDTVVARADSAEIQFFLPNCIPGVAPESHSKLGQELVNNLRRMEKRVPA